MKKRMILLAFALTWFAILLNGSILRAADSETCEPKSGFLILNDQSYALCATATCFGFNQLAYCKCNLLNGNSISLPFEYGDNQNICTLNEQGKTNGFRASTFSFPEGAEYPDGKLALYTCPGEVNKGEGGFAARGSYAQCDGGLCFTSTEGNMFPGFADALLQNEIICSCPFATSCEILSENPAGYQISGPYEGECNPDACERCNAATLTEDECKLPNPVSQIGVQENIPVGAQTGVPEALACLLLDGNVPDANSCLCQCASVDSDGICTEWTVEDKSPLEVSCTMTGNGDSCSIAPMGASPPIPLYLFIPLFILIRKFWRA
ncbi:MAG: hypothetical protein RIG61_12840 [Deltaproteobacteria bacterium]